MTGHEIRTREEKPGRYQATCTCGQYRSRLFGHPGHAEQAGRAHLAAKGGRQ